MKEALIEHAQYAWIHYAQESLGGQRPWPHVEHRIEWLLCALPSGLILLCRQYSAQGVGLSGVPGEVTAELH